MKSVCVKISPQQFLIIILVAITACAEPASPADLTGLCGMWLSKLAYLLRKTPRTYQFYIERHGRFRLRPAPNSPTTNSEIAALLGKQDYVVSLFSQKKAPTSPDLKQFDILGDQRVVPRNGIVHVVGPGPNFLEWVMPLMARPDIRLFVSESPESEPPSLYWQVMRALYSENGLNEVWTNLQREHRVLIENSHIKSVTDLKAAIDQRLIVIRDVRKTLFDETDTNAPHPGTPIPKADLIIAMSPYVGGTRFANQAKSGTVMWVATRRFEEYVLVPHAVPVPLKTALIGSPFTFQPFVWVHMEGIDWVRDDPSVH